MSPLTARSDHSLLDVLSGHARNKPQAHALAGNKATGLTFSRWHSAASDLAVKLADYSLDGRTVVVHLHDADLATAAVTAVAAVAAHCTVVLMSTRFSVEDVGTAALAYGATAILTSDGLVDGYAMPTSVHVHAITELVGAGWRQRHRSRQRRNGEGQFLIHTSGSTGRPRGVLCPPGEHAGWVNRHPQPDVGPLLHPFPFDSTGGLGALMFAVAGRTIVRVGPFDSANFAASLKAHRPHDLMVVPAQIRTLMSTRQPLDEDAAHGVRTVTITAATVDDRVIDFLRTQFAHAIVINSYAMTEAGHATTQLKYPSAGGKTPPLCTSPPGSTCVGWPDSDTEVAIHGSDLVSAPVGEVWLRDISGLTWRCAWGEGGPPTGGWVRTGDLGVIDTTGALHLCGRMADMVVRDGQRFAFVEIEQVIRRHSDVVDVAVLATTDPRPLLVAVLDLSTTGSAEAIKQFTSVRLPLSRQPDRYIEVDRLLHTATGKLDRLGLARRYFASDLQAHSQHRSF